MSRVITIDGPAGVGKGTISKLLSHYLNAEILNSGEIYRTIAYNIIKHKINPNDISSIIEYVKNFDYEPLSSNKLYNKNIDLVSLTKSDPEFCSSSMKLITIFLSRHHY